MVVAAAAAAFVVEGKSAASMAMDPKTSMTLMKLTREFSAEKCRLQTCYCPECAAWPAFRACKDLVAAEDDPCSDDLCC